MSFLIRELYSDEYVFHVDGRVSHQNVRTYGKENVCERRKVAGGSDKVAVWCAMFVNQVIGL